MNFRLKQKNNKDNRKSNGFCKVLAVVIVCLFVGASMASGISERLKNDDTEKHKKNVSEHKTVDIEKKSMNPNSGSEGGSVSEHLDESSSQQTNRRGEVDWWPMFHHDLNHSGYSTSNGPETNNIIWSYQTGGGVDSSAAVVDGKVYVGSFDHNIYCLDAGSGSEVWSYQTGNSVISSPAVADGKVFIGSDDDTFYCLNVFNGSKIWDYTAGLGVESSPAVIDEKVYVGSCDGNVYCLNTISGNKIWSYNTGNGGVFPSPAVADDKVYVGNLDGNLYCLDAENGSKIWSYQTGNTEWSSPTVTNDKIYIGSDIGNLYCLDAENGSKIWSYQTGNSVISSPAVADGKVFIGSDDHNIYCLDAENGSKIWSYQTGNDVESSPAIADGKVYIGSYDGNVYCLDADNGNKIWSYYIGSEIFSSPAVAGGKIYIGSRDNKIYCFGNQPVLDVNQSTFNRGFPIRHAVDGDWAGAQNFTPTMSVITKVELYLRAFGIPEFNLTVELRENSPQGNLLDTVVFTPSEVPSSWGWLNVDFTDVTVTPGTDYFIVVPPAPSGVTTSFGYEWGYCFGDVYPDGAFWFTRDGGTLWRDLPSMYEFTFQTYGVI